MSAQVKIISLKRVKNRVSITLSNSEPPLTISEETVYRHRLVDGIVITPAQLEQLKRESELFRCNNETTRLLALREHSTGEIKNKLKRKGFNHGVIKEIISKFTKQGFLDDAHFAYNLAQRIVRDQPCGKPYLTGYLQRKMINRSLAEQTVEMIFSEKDEYEQALLALKKRWRTFSQFKLEVARKKAYNYLARRGFGYDAAKRAFEKLLNQKQEDTSD